MDQKPIPGTQRISAKLGEQYIKDCLIEYGELSTQQLQDLTGMNVNQVRNRIRNLIDMGEVLPTHRRAAETESTRSPAKKPQERFHAAPTGSPARTAASPQLEAAAHIRILVPNYSDSGMAIIRILKNQSVRPAYDAEASA